VDVFVDGVVYDASSWNVIVIVSDDDVDENDDATTMTMTSFRHRYNDATMTR